MKLISSLTRTKFRTTVTGVVSAAVIATGAGFISITAPWSSPDHVSNIEPVPVKEWTPPATTTDTDHQLVDNPEANGTGVTIEGDGTGVLPTAPAAPTDGSGQAGSRSVPVRPISLVPASVPLAPVPGNDKGSGDFTAIPGTSSGSWGVTGQTGAFTWSYPFSLREAPAGPTPSLGISYDSSRVDGLTSATNNQASVVGDGWTLDGGGQIKQQFGSCDDQGVANSYDLCAKPGGQQFSMSFGGRSGLVIRDANSGDYKLQNDDNTKIEYVDGTTNGTFDGGHWKLTDTSGTQYFFGLNRLPGWVAGKATTNSTDTVPVAAAAAGQPCYNATFANSFCSQAYAWNLDYVVDSNGNSQAFYYTQDTNYYKAQNGTGALKSYVRASRLARVDYGMRAGTELTAQAPLHVTMGYTARCSGVVCTDGTDVPTTFACASTGTCGTYSPTFYTDVRLQTVITQSLSVNPAGYGDTDYWTFFHAMKAPGDGTKPSLWLGSLIHQGSNRTSTGATGFVDDPPVIFAGGVLHNRVWAVDGLAPFGRFRLSEITTATGAKIQVTYKAAECSATNLPASAETNTKRCFPQRWTPTTPVQLPRTDYFHIYPVERVVSKAGPGGAGGLDLTTTYGYVGTPAWKYAAPKYIAGTAGQDITWSVLAGWSQVKSKVGTAASNPTTVTTYLRGLNGTPSNKTGGLRTDAVTLSDNTVITDSVWLAGQEIEKQSYAGDGGTLLGTTITVPWASAPTATGTVATGAAQARYIGVESVTKKATTSKSASMRVSQTSTTYDAYGRAIKASSKGEIGSPGDETCTVTAYADNIAANILSLAATNNTFAGECATPGNLLKASRTLYDTSTSAIPGSSGYVAPTKGNATRSDTAVTVSGTSVTAWEQGPTLAFDALGRQVKSTDSSTGSARVTTVTYAPASGLPATVTVQNAALWKVITTLDSMRGQPLTRTDPNGLVTSYRYDQSGRVTGEWDPMRPAATNSAPTVETSYSISQTNPSWVKKVAVAGNGADIISFDLYDGLGRERQTQRKSPGGGSIITDTWYDSRGAKSLVNNDYFISNGPDGVLRIPQLAVQSSTQYEHDAAGRPTKVRAMAGENQELWATQVSYTGSDTSTITGPGNKSATKTVINLDGSTESQSVFHGTVPTGTADTSSYVYDALGQRVRMGDGSNLWTWGYDAAGREISAVDPDSGARSTMYDASGRTASTTNALGEVTGYVYDVLDRVVTKTQKLGAAAPTTLETYTYDQGKLGTASTSTRYNGGTLLQPVKTTLSNYNNAYQPQTTTVELPAGLKGLSGTYETTRTYSTTGKVLSQTTPAIGGLPAETVNYGFDGLENPLSTWNQDGDQFAGNADYDHLGNLVTYVQYDINTLLGGSRNMTGTNNTYFAWSANTGQLSEQWTTNSTRGVTSDLGKTKYTYDQSGRLTARELSYGSRPNVAADYQCYTYDHASRLSAVWTPASKTCTTAPTPASANVTGLGGPAPFAQTYAYTAAGDRSEVKRFGVTGALAAREQYSYPAPGTVGPHRVKSIVSTVSGVATTWDFGWDAAGRMADRSGQTLTYTEGGLLATTTGNSDIPANPNPGATAGTPKPPTTGAGSTGTRYYDAAGSLVGIVDGTGTTVTLDATTAHASAATTPIKSATTTYSFAGKTVAQRTAAGGAVKLSLIVGDGVNTAQTMTLPTVGSGSVTTVQRYTDPFGLARGANVTAAANASYTAAPQGTAGVGSNAANPAGFGAANGYIGGLDDSVSSLTHLGARDLDRITGAFTSADPLLDPSDSGHFSAYAYSQHDPINSSDPSGLLTNNIGCAFSPVFCFMPASVWQPVDAAAIGIARGLGRFALRASSGIVAGLMAPLMNAVFYEPPSSSYYDAYRYADECGWCAHNQPNQAAVYAGNGFLSFAQSGVRTIAGSSGYYSGGSGYSGGGSWYSGGAGKARSLAGAGPAKPAGPSLADPSAQSQSRARAAKASADAATAATGKKANAQNATQTGGGRGSGGPPAKTGFSTPDDDFWEIANKIAKGHAWKHKNEFPGMSQDGLARLVRDVLENGMKRVAENGKPGRTAHFKDGTVVMRDPGNVDGGTVFRPNDPFGYWLKQ